MKYAARIEGDTGDFVLRFRDIPEAISGGATMQEARDLALDCLVTAMDFYFDDRRQVPPPSKARRGEFEVALPPSVAAKVLLLNRMLQERVTPAELARRLDTTPQSVNRLVDLRHATKIDTLAEALRALGAELEVSLAPG